MIARLETFLLIVCVAAAGATLPVDRASAAETLAVVAVGEPPNGIDADLAELAHQLRAACRDRVGNVLDVPSMQARFLGQSGGATASELDRAYGGALAVYQNGEFESALRTLRAIVADIEALPEGREPYRQWIRAQLRLAHAAATIGRFEEADAVMTRLLRVEPNYRADPDQYSPTYRRRMDEIRARVQAMPQRRVTVIGAGKAGSIFVDGRPSGTTPMTLFLPAGRYRIGGGAGTLRVPSFPVDLADEDRTVVLDFETADAIRMASGPGLLLPVARRAEGLIRAGAWLDVDKLVVASRVFEGDAPFLAGAIYDVRRGSLLREGTVRTVAGTVPSVNIGALAAFLLTGAQQREVHARSHDGAVASAAASQRLAPPPDPMPASAPPVREPEAPATEPPKPARSAPDLRPRPPEVGAPESVPLGNSDGEGGSAGRSPASRRGWRRPAAWVSGGLALGFAGLAVNRRLAADDAYGEAAALLGPGAALTYASDRPRYLALVSQGDAAMRSSWLSAGASVLLAAAAGYLGWTSAPSPATASAF